MGLMIHSLGELPSAAERGYYVYLLDYGWEEPLGEALSRNFERMASLASENDAVVMRGVVGSHFVDEVLSWHSINGQPGDEMLPAILITTRHPGTFRGEAPRAQGKRSAPDDRMMLIPLRSVCRDSTEVADLIDAIFRGIKESKRLVDFEIVKEMKRGQDQALRDILVLRPTFMGVGVDLMKLVEKFLPAGHESARPKKTGR